MGTPMAALHSSPSFLLFPPHLSCIRLSRRPRILLPCLRPLSSSFHAIIPSAAAAAAPPSPSDRSNASLDKLSEDLGMLFNAGDFGAETVMPPPPLADEPLPKQTLECPPGLKHYETMAVLRPDINEDQRLAFTQRYEEAIIAGGGMGVEVFNRGMMPLAYTIRKKNMAGISNKYLDGIYYLFTYFTKPESQFELQKKFNSDEDLIRWSTVVIKPVRA